MPVFIMIAGPMANPKGWLLMVDEDEHGNKRTMTFDTMEEAEALIKKHRKEGHMWAPFWEAFEL